MLLLKNARVWRVYAAFTLAMIVYCLILLPIALVVAITNGFNGITPGWLEMLLWIMVGGVVLVILPAVPLIVTVLWRSATGKD